jgi:acyl-CoA thioesterase FadM
VARLDSISRAAFRALVRPGDQLTVTCRRRAAGDADTRWTVAATALVAGQTVATATLGISVVDDADGVGSRLRAMHQTLGMDAIQIARLERG